MLFYRAALPLSTKTLNHVAGIIRRYRKALGSRWRKLAPAQQALLVLAYLRKAEGREEAGSAYVVVDGTLIAIGRNKSWKIFRKLRCCPWRAGKLAKAVYALEIHA